MQMGKDDSTVCKSGGMMTVHTVGNDGSAHCANVRGNDEHAHCANIWVERQSRRS